MLVQVDELKVFVATGGKDFDPDLPTILFLHGSGGDHRTWAMQTRWFAYNGFSVLAPDLPGHSLSDGNAFSTIEDSGIWLAKFLHALSVDKVHLVGHSQGFLTALVFAERHNEAVRSITAIGTAAEIPVNEHLIKTAETSRDKAAEMMCNWGFGPNAHQGISSVPGMQPIGISRAIMRNNPLEIDLRACAEFKRGSEISKDLSMHRHCILASHDKMTPMKAGLSLAKNMSINPKIIQNSGHMLPIESPKKTLLALREFIETIES